MYRGLIIGTALAAALLIPRYVRAHEGHPHKVLGSVVMRHENHLQEKSTDGKSAEITLNEKTTILRGTVRVKLDDIKPGERIVVTAPEGAKHDVKRSGQRIVTIPRSGAEGLREPPVLTYQRGGSYACRGAKRDAGTNDDVAARVEAVLGRPFAGVR